MRRRAGRSQGPVTNRTPPPPITPTTTRRLRSSLRQYCPTSGRSLAGGSIGSMRVPQLPLSPKDPTCQREAPPSAMNIRSAPMHTAIALGVQLPTGAESGHMTNHGTRSKERQRAWRLCSEFVVSHATPCSRYRPARTRPARYRHLRDIVVSVSADDRRRSFDGDVSRYLGRRRLRTSR